MKYDNRDYPYPSQRMSVYARHGMVSTAQPLAAQAGLKILQKGGNAIDAAIATAACLTVVEPTSNGIGGDAFAIVWFKNNLYGLNASGPAPNLLDLKTIQNLGLTAIPEYGWLPVTVPGTPSAWVSLSERFGKLPLYEVLKPAIEYATEGFPVSPVVARNWKEAFTKYSTHLKGQEFEEWFRLFAPESNIPLPGSIWSSIEHAQTLERIAITKGRDFYSGDIAEKIDAFSKKHGGYLRKKDLESYKPEWVEPISVNYRGFDVWEIPPNGHGLVTLMALNILNGFEFKAKELVDTYHLQIEALKLAYADGLHYIADPKKGMKVPIQDLLSPNYADARRKLIQNMAINPIPGKPPKGGTVYLATADSEGNMVSYIQSNYMGFGSGLVVPGTGIALHNRGCNFSLEKDHPNCLEPRKRPYHTIIPGFITKDNSAIGPFGVMGGFMQPQGHVQVISNIIDFELNCQAALDAPRWRWTNERNIEVEPLFPQPIVEALERKGHKIIRTAGVTVFGRGQIIRRLSNGALEGGSDPRADGYVSAW